jgi:hypothetical protein
LITAIGGEMLAAPGDVRPKIGAKRRLLAFQDQKRSEVNPERVQTAPNSARQTRLTAADDPEAAANAATTDEAEVTMDASTYGRLVERGGYATGGIVRTTGPTIIGNGDRECSLPLGITYGLDGPSALARLLAGPMVTKISTA